MKIKRILCFILVLIFAASIIGCSSGKSSKDDDDDDRKTSSGSKKDKDDDDDSSGGGLLDKLKDKDDGSSSSGDSGSSSADSGSSSGDPGSSSGDGGSSSGDPGNSGSGIIDKIVRGKSDADAKLTIYKIGENSVVFVVEGSACAALIPEKDKYYGDKEFYLEIESMGVKSTLQTKGGWWQVEGGDYFWANEEETCAGDNIYYARMNSEGIASKFNLNGDYIFVYKPANSGTSEGDIIKEGKAADLVKEMTEEEYNKLVVDTYMHVKAESPAQADWNGTYTLDYSYDGSTGWVSAEVTEGGLIHFHVKYNDYERDFFAKEKDYDAVEYSYGRYVTAKVELIGKDRYNKDFEFKQEPDAADRMYVSYSDYNVDPSVYFSENFTKFTEWHVAPADYSDTDRDGFISALDLSTEPFKPLNDNYTINYNRKDTVWLSDGDITCATALLRSFDANDMVIQEVTAYIASTEDEARRIFQSKQANAYDYYLVSMSGNIVYNAKVMDDYRYDNKLGTIGSVASQTWYIGCHYAYQQGYGDYEYSNSYVYINKPITSKEYNIDLEAGLYWKAKKNIGSAWRSMDMKDVTLYAYINDYSLDLSVSGTSGFNGMSFDSSRSVRADSLNMVGVSYYRNWVSGAYEYYVIFRTYEFGEEAAAVTDYFFKVDSFDNVDITFDNFPDKTADHVISQRFDMTRSAN